MANVVMGTIENYSKAQIEPFVCSLRASGYDDEIVFFGTTLSKEMENFLISQHVRFVSYRIIRFQRGMKAIRGLFIRIFKAYTSISFGNVFPFRDTIIKLFWHCQAARYYYYDDFLRTSPVKYQKILICDVRDTLFQKYPFPEKMEFDIYCFEEYPGIKLSQQEQNKEWIERLFGDDVLKELSNKSVLCSGLILATHDGMRRLFGEMKSFLWKDYKLLGYDQGVFNFLIYKGLLTNVKIGTFGEGVAMHIGIAPRDKISTGKKGEVLCNDGTICPIVHQYDRHPDIQANLLKMHGAS